MRKWSFIAALVLFVLQANAQFEKLELGARQALAKDKPYRALTLTERALTRKGAPATFHVIRAEAYNRIGAYQKAMDELQKAPELKANADYRTNLIGSYTGLGRLDSAEVLIAPQVDPQASEEYLYRAGRVLALRERWREALAHFQAGVEHFPGSARMVRERGACHAMLGDATKANADLDQAVKLAPRDAANYNSRGYYGHMVFGRYKEAIADMDLAIKQDPNYGFAFSNRGWCYYQLGDLPKARKDLGLAVRKNPNNAYAYRSLGIVDLALGEKQSGCANLRKALELRFTEVYGKEVESIVERDCGMEAVPAPVVPAPPTPAPPPSNAPDTPSPRRSNAP